MKKYPLYTFWLIVGCQILLYSISTFAQADSCIVSPDVIYYNGSIITMDEFKPTVEAIAIKGDTILAVGTNEEVLSLVSSECSTKIIDLNGLTMLPGFNESHCHWFSWREHICSVSGLTTYPSLEEIMTMLSENGWTSISELNFGRPDVAPEHLNNAMALEASGKLSVRLNGYWGTLDDGSLLDVLADSSRTPSTYYSERIKARGVKMYVDNPFGAYDLLSQEEVNNLVQRAHQAGWQIAAHAVNESAVEKILTAYENVLGDETNGNYRYRIEHAVKVSDNQLNRMKQKGIIASFQLLGPADWPNQSDFGSRFLTSNSEWVMRWKDFVEADSAGLKITGSTDAPFNDAPCDYSPFRIIYQAVTRKGYIDRTLADWELNQRISIMDCLKLLTIDGAYSTFEENKKGSLVPGKWADFVIVSENPLEVSTPEDLLNIKIVKTVVGGKTEFCNDVMYESLCNDAVTFSVNSTLVSASNFLPENNPTLAFDNNLETIWLSGDFPPQWIQVDLLNDVKISGIDLVVSQYPDGQTIHEVWGKSSNPNDHFNKLTEFAGFTKTGDTLKYSSLSGFDSLRFIKIVTTQSPSWVAWEEIMVRKFIPTLIENESSHFNNFILKQNYPNPFNPTTTIKYSLPKVTSGFTMINAQLIVYDVLGREIITLVNNIQSPGNYDVKLDASNLPSGVYFYKLKYGQFTDIKKMLYIK